MTRVPLIDLRDEACRVARFIDAALTSTGFFGITGHGVDPALVDAAFAASRGFFTRPDADKQRWHIGHSPLRRGWDPVGWQGLDPAQPPDLKESFYLGAEYLGPNPWPDEALVPGFRAATTAYAAAMRALSHRLLGLFALALDEPADVFTRHLQHPVATLRLLHYPPQPATVAPGQLGCGAHTDWGALTLLAQDAAGGLQVRPGTDEAAPWVDVPPQPGALMVNIGDMMQRWTNDRWPSTLHRVVNRRAGAERWSIAYFCDLDSEAVITPLPRCTSASRPARYGPITAGEHLEAMYRMTTVAPAATAA